MERPLRDESLRRAVRASVQQGLRDIDDGSSVCVVVPDATRPLAFSDVLSPLIEQLTAVASNIEIVVGLGLHRPMTPDESAPIRQLAGDFDIAWSQHDATADDLVDFGLLRSVDAELPQTAPDDLPVVLNRRVVDADCVVCVGTVEPHQYAGYSGGVKAVSIGCAGASTIGAMHGLSLLRSPDTTLGCIDDNPFRACLDGIGEFAGSMWGLQLVPAADGGVVDVWCGSLNTAFHQAVERASGQFFQTIDDAPLDWCYLPVSSPKDSNFYQASRAATYAALVERPAIADGGVIIVDADCPEKMGDGAGERACAEAMARGRDALLEELTRREPVETRGGQQRAYVLARALERNPIVLVGAPEIEALGPMGIEQLETVDAVFRQFNLDVGAGRRIDDVFHRIPQA